MAEPPICDPRLVLRYLPTHGFLSDRGGAACIMTKWSARGPRGAERLGASVETPSAQLQLQPAPPASAGTPSACGECEPRDCRGFV